MNLFPDTLPIYAGLPRSAGGQEWLDALPGLVADLAERWGLELGEPFHGGSASWVAPATRSDGSPAVLKISWPHREAREEATALRLWDGQGACRLLAEDRDAYALLIERCRPGVLLKDLDTPADERLLAAAAVLAKLWSAGAAPGFEAVADVTAEWADVAAERMGRLRPPYDPGLVRHGVELLRSLPRTATRSVIVHGDFNPGNLLSADRAGWLAIDAKPMVGDPGYDPFPLLMQVDPPFLSDDPGPVLRHRYRLFAGAVGEPVERLLAWSVARGVESALWYASRDDVPAGADAMAEATTLADLL
ncbi:MAG TPA: aminoglycoside phosphotransferase family protein [Mycobacteriales bacterium]|nr:aminoglycoside phosphotransferase family protein [Mycobacteriales bacterium]